ncbi:MAG: hypothetical protein OHK0032_00730 [Thermodesulfovibrionales bacterium]
MVPVYLLGFIILGLVSGYLAFKLLSFSRTVEVPDLRGKTLLEANSLLNKRGLYLKVEGEDHDPAVAPGNIARQDIPPGNKVKEQRGIKVILSKGPKVLFVPEFTGMSIEEAESVAAKSGLRVSRILRVHSDVVEKDRIIAQRPNPEEPIQGELSIVVSAGPYSSIYYCPDFSNKGRDEAQGLAEKLGLEVEFKGSGEWVRSQKPKPGSLIKSGETIHLQLGGENNG